MLATVSRWAREGPLARLLPIRVRVALERLAAASGYGSRSTPYGLSLRDDSPAATLLFGGDVALHRWTAGTRPETLLAGVAPVVAGADALIVNLESQLTERTEPAGVTGSSLRADPTALEALQYLRASAVTCANNHCLDFGPAALAESVDRVRDAGILVSGVGRSAASTPAVLSAGPLNIGLLAYADDWRPAGAGEPDPGPVPHAPERVRADIAALRRAVDLVVVQLHWGYEWAMYPLRRYRDLARSYVDAGADVVVCHHAHVPMGVEARGRGIIAHGLGNFYFGPPGRDRHPFRSLSFLLRVTVAPGGVVAAEAVPVMTDDAGRLGAAGPEASGRMAGALELLSRRLGEDAYLDRVEATLLSEQGALLFRDMVRRLGDGDAGGFAERCEFLKTPRQRMLLESFRQRSGDWGAIGEWMERAREGPVSLTPDLTRMDRRAGELLDRLRPVGRVP